MEDALDQLETLDAEAQQQLGNAQLALSLALAAYGQAEAALAAARVTKDQAAQQFRTAAMAAGIHRRNLQLAKGAL